MGNWFEIKKIDEDTFAISEPYHWEETNCYLLCGSERALLIDTGLGISDISEEVKKLTDKPITAIPTHVHWDHIGGLKYYQNFYVHDAEEEWISGNFPLSDEFVKNMAVKSNNLPDSFKPDEYHVFQGIPAGIVQDGNKIDLGERIIEIIHTPGHSPGHLCFFEEEKGFLFTGDLIYKGTLFANYPSTDPEKFLESVEKISFLNLKKIFPAHHDMNIKPEMIFDVIRELKILKNEGKLCHGSGIYDYGIWKMSL